MRFNTKFCYFDHTTTEPNEHIVIEHPVGENSSENVAYALQYINGMPKLVHNNYILKFCAAESMFGLEEVVYGYRKSMKVKVSLVDISFLRITILNILELPNLIKVKAASSQGGGTVTPIFLSLHIPSSWVDIRLPTEHQFFKC